MLDIVKRNIILYIPNRNWKNVFVIKITFFRAHENENIASFSPRSFNVPCFLLVITRAGHDPAEHPNFFFQFTCHRVFTCNVTKHFVTEFQAKSEVSVIPFIEN